ncbi:hypothetical protein [uncultured Cocleimonas sp.]|uniref:hypothetical protein n=1 Tax=uncultured Cocleimonas sp. TaxID=1051587 RepID=UPI002616FC0B|nr:hypothetical protein [uncultured Cocleimonas sp.]
MPRFLNWKVIRNTLSYLCLIGWVFPHTIISAENSDNKKLPSPLDLTTALSFASEHPRTRLTPEQTIATPPQQSLFLGCHNLTFNNTSISDSQRNTAATLLVEPSIQQQLLILRAYFDVLLSDSSLIGINEDMAGTFISWDRAKIRQELKQYSELIVARLEAEYQEVRQQYFSSQATQRLTRSILAQTINRPDELSSDLIPPILITSPKTLPEFSDLYAEALKNNSWLKTLREKYNKDQMTLFEMDLRQQILELVLRLSVLKVAADRAESELYSRDLDLEMSRSLYEMEVRATLGKSMTLQSKARMKEERVKYCITIAWAQLNALTGKPILTQPEEAKEETQ